MEAETGAVWKWLDEEKNSLITFCAKFRYIFLYGAGNYGYVMLKFFQREKINVTGFFVSHPVDSSFEGKPVYAIDSCPYPKEQCGIVFSVRGNVHEIIYRHLLQHGYPEDHILITKEKFLRLRSNLDRMSVERIQSLYREFPPASFTGDASWKKICVICNDGIGETILTTPFLRELRRNYPHQYIAFVTLREAAPLFAHCPYIDQLFVYSADQMMYIDDIIEEKTKRFAQQYLVQEKFDVVFVPCSYTWIVVNTYMAAYSQVPVRIAHAVYGESLKEDRLCNHDIDTLYSLAIEDIGIPHEVERRLDLLRSIGKPVENSKIELWCSNADRSYAENIIQEHVTANLHDIIAIVPVASVGTRCWDTQKMMGLMKKILDVYPMVKFMILGAQNTEDAANLLQRCLPQDCIINMVNRTTLPQAVALMQYARLYIGMNTGLIHVAAACGIPVVEVSPHPVDGDMAHDNSPLRYHAFGVPDIVVQPDSGLDDCTEYCMEKRPHCINQVTVDAVFQAAMEMIRRERIFDPMP